LRDDEIAKFLKLSAEDVLELAEMSGKVYQSIIYTVDELEQIYKTGEAFRIYKKNPKHALEEIRAHLGKVTNTIEVSNIGNVKINGEIVAPFEKDGDIYVILQKRIDYKVYRLVAETWCDFPFKDTSGWHVHHIKYDLNNNANNLIWCAGKIHLQKVH